MFSQSLPCFSLCPLPLVMSLDTAGKSLALCSLHPRFLCVYIYIYIYRHTLYIYIYICTLVRCPLSLLFSSLHTPSSLSLSLYERCSSPFIIFVGLLWTLSSMPTPHLYRGAQNWTQYSKCGFTSAEYRGRITSLDLLQYFAKCSPRYHQPSLIQPGSFSTWCPLGSPVFFRKDVFQLVVAQHILVHGFFPLQV